MFSKFSKFRTKGGSRGVSPQRDRHDEQSVYYSPSYGKPPQPSSPQAPRTPPQLGRRTISPLSQKKHGAKPSFSHLPEVAPLEPNYDTDDTDENISFAETLFPVTPNRVQSAAVLPRGGRRSSESSWSSEGRDGLSDVQMNRRGGWEYRRDQVESKRTSWDASSGNNNKRLDRVATALSDWTSSSLPEEDEIDSGPPVLPPYDDAEEEFLEEFEEYFNHLHVDHVRRAQYPKLELQKLVYLDYASFALFANSQVPATIHLRDLIFSLAVSYTSNHKPLLLAGITTL